MNVEEHFYMQLNSIFYYKGIFVLHLLLKKFYSEMNNKISHFLTGKNGPKHYEVFSEDISGVEMVFKMI